MGEQTMETQKKVSLTKKDLNKAYWTFETYAQACCSYERLQAPGFFSGMRNIIDKLYDDDPEQKAEACQRHMEFYNSEFAHGRTCNSWCINRHGRGKGKRSRHRRTGNQCYQDKFDGDLWQVSVYTSSGKLVPIIGSIRNCT